MMNKVVIGFFFLIVACQTRQEQNKPVATVLEKPDSLEMQLQQDSVAKVAQRARVEARLDSLAAIAKSKPIWGERMTLTGDFDGDGTVDTLYEKYISQLTGKETNKNYDFSGEIGDGLDFISYWQKWIGEKNVLLKLTSKKPEIKPFVVDKGGLHHGFLYLKNVRDLNKDSTDEIAFILNYVDFSNSTIGYLATYKNEKWKVITSWEATEIDFQYDPAKKRKPDPKYVFVKSDGSVYIKEFDGNRLGNIHWKRLKTNW